MSNRSLTPAERFKTKSSSFQDSFKKKADALSSFNHSFRLRSTLTKDNTMTFQKNTDYVRNRVHKRCSSAINPEIAAEVVKEYILPMFRKEFKNKEYKRRQKDRGLESKLKENKGLDIVPGSLYAEIALTDQLAGEIKNLKDKIQELEKKNKELEQEKYVIVVELNKIKNDFLDLQVNFQSVMGQCMKNEVYSNFKIQDYDNMYSRCEYYKGAFDSTRVEIENANKIINEAKLTNNIRFKCYMTPNS